MSKIKKSLNLILLIFLITGNTRAQDTVHVNKDQPAPFSGFLFSEEKTKEIRHDLLELDKTKLELDSKSFQLDSFKQIYEVQKEEIVLYKEQNQRLLNQEKMSNTEKYIWFALGIVLTSGSIYLATLLL